MPRVSPEHLEATRERILDAARRCFTRDGFHVTSMQDILAEAGLSAGGVYRHFRSKDEIIGAIAAAALDDVSESLRDVFEAPVPPPLDEVVRRFLSGRPPLDGRPASARLLLQVWAEAARSPALAERYAEAYRAWRAFFTRLLEVYQRSGQVTSSVSATLLAPALIAVLYGCMVQLALVGDVDIATLQSGVRGLIVRNGGLT
jgi:AcrR family transcriptional regulator